MKKLILLLSIFITISASAGVITCSNNPNSPGQYTSLQDAIDNANANDTILVHGSSTHYGTVTNNSKALTIIGAGVNNPNGLNTEVNYIYFSRISSTISASGSKLIGFRVINGLVLNPNYGTNTANRSISNIEIERCHLGYISFDGASTVTNYSDITIKNNILGIVTFGQGIISNIKVLNNIFSGNGIHQNAHTDNSDILIANNLFINNNIRTFETPPGLTSNPGMTVSNNIFYNCAPNGNCYNCSFSNNISYQNVNDTLVGSNNIGATGGGNLLGQDPMFVNYPIIGGAFNYSYDFHLQSGSPGIGAGTDGTDIGIYGGAAPFEVGANPAIPQMQEITTPIGSTVSKGTNLNVTFKSYKQD